MSYNEILNANGFDFLKTCHCNGIYTEVYHVPGNKIEARIHPRTTQKKTQIKKYGRVVFTGTLNNLNQFDEHLKEVKKEEI